MCLGLGQHGQHYSQNGNRLNSARYTICGLWDIIFATPNIVADKVQIFLAHASEDKKRVRNLRAKLRKHGFEPWLDEKDLSAGTYWESEIPKLIRASDCVICCFSATSIHKNGYVQRELRLALDEYTKKPAGTRFLFPVKFEPCAIPDLELDGVKLSGFHCINLCETNGFKKLRGDLNATLNP